jgi:glycosyltransferase involved in cell wall biosynthesis
MGEPAPRKGGQMVFDTFSEVFGINENATLTIKAHGYNTVRGRRIYQTSEASPNSRSLELDTYQLVDLVQRHDVLLYPSYGEGFGLIPLQAMVTGMPVVCTGAWAPYKAPSNPGASSTLKQD